MPTDHVVTNPRSIPRCVINLPLNTTHMTIPMFAEFIANAAHPRLPGELPLWPVESMPGSTPSDCALAHQYDGEGHFSVAPATADNVAHLREIARGSHEMSMQKAVSESEMRILGPATLCPYTVRFEGNPTWRREVNEAVVPIDDLIKYAEKSIFRVNFSSSGVDVSRSVDVGFVTPSETMRSLRDVGKAATAAKHREWIQAAQELKLSNPKLTNVAEIARRIERQFRGTPNHAAANTIRNIINGAI